MIDEAVFRKWAEIDDSDKPGNYWGVAACLWRNETGAAADEAIDRVVVASISKSGDLRPLAALLYLGRAPSANVLRMVAKMIAPELAGPRIDYVIETKRADGRPGRARTLEAVVQDAGVAGLIDAQTAGGVKYDAAISELAADLGMSDHAVRKAQSRGRHGN